MFKMLRSQPRDNNNKLSYNVFDSNRTGASAVVLDAWHEGFKTKGLESGLLKIDSETGQINIDTTKGKEYNKRFKEIRTSDDSFNKKLDNLSKLFNDLGINVSKQELSKLNDDRDSVNKTKRKYKYSKYYSPHKDFTTFMQEELSYIFNTIAGSRVTQEAVDQPWQDNNPFYSQTKRLSGLAAYHAEFNPDVTSSSFRDANGNIIQAYVMPHHFSNRLEKIKRDAGYRNILKGVPFIKNSTWLNEDVSLSYFDASKNAKSYQKAKDFSSQSPTEKELTKIGLFQKSGKKAIFIGNVPSDKSRFPLLEVTRHVLGLGSGVFVNGNINSDSINLESDSINTLHNVLIQSEINRINAVVKQYNSRTKDELIPGYHYMTDAKSGKTVVGSGAYFFFIPELNEELKGYRNEEGGLDLGTEGINKAKEVLADKLVQLAQDKVKSWNEKGIVNFEKGEHSFDKSYSSELSTRVSPEGKAQNLINQAATEMVANYMLSYANQFQLITGDPALFTKPNYKFRNAESLISNTADNIFKRTAKDIAPGVEGVFDSPVFKTIFINEPKDISEVSEYKDRLGGLAKKYTNMDLADAQEWTTVEEHINVLHAFGKMSRETRDALLEKINKRKEAPQEEKEKYNLTWDEIRTVLQPTKPVYVTSTLDEDLNTDVHYYIKTSSFPLIPQLTEGMEIDKLREAMEENEVDRAVVASGVKTGFRNSIDIFKNGKVTIPDNFNFGIQELERTGFRIQQEVPHDYTKNSILEGSQLRKLKFANLTTDLTFNIGKRKYKGYQLKNLDDAIHDKLYQERYENLLNRLGVGDNGHIDATKLRDELRSTAAELGYSYNDIMMLNTRTLNSGKVVFDIPLFFHNEANKVESMLNSIIKNKVLKNKMSGLSFVQGSASGFINKFAGEEFAANMLKITGSRIAYTKHYNGEKLDYREYEEDGKKIIYGEVFAPFYFLNKRADGTKEPLRIEDYVDDNGFILEDKIDDELLNMLGYRIPTQGHNSMIKLKIVGFLPQEAGDLIIVPGAITKQMGSDFDVDKLYTHFYNYTSEKGKLVKVGYDLDNDVSTMNSEQLQNLSMDITYSILSNETVQNKYQFQPIDNPALEKDKQIIKSLKKGEEGTSLRTQPQKSSIIYDEYQSHMVDVNAAGKVGIGSFSTASTNHILFQYAGVHITVPKNKEGKPIEDKAISIMFSDNEGKIYTDRRSGEDFENNRVNDHKAFEYAYSPRYGAWRLDKVFTFPNPVTGEKKSISEVISYYQSASVDNAKDQHLYDLHQNPETFRVTSLIARAGFDEMFINRFINQPVVVEYVKRIINSNNFTENVFEPKKLEKIQSQLFSEYGIDNPKSLKLTAPSLNQMEEALKSGGKDKQFQGQVLHNFLQYVELSKEIGAVQNSINTDTAFLGKSIYSSVLKRQKLENTNNSPYLAGLGRLIETEEGLTTQGSATAYGLFGSINLFSGNNLYPLNSPAIETIFDDISKEIGRDIDEDLAYSIMSDVRAGLFSNAIEQVYDQNTDELREELLFGKGKKLSLAKRLHALKQTSTNPFVNALSVNTAYQKGEPDTIEFTASKEIKEELNFSMLIGWNNLLNAPEGSTERQIGEDLVKYSLAIGNQRSARDFGRFLPYDYIVNSGLSEYLRGIDFYDVSNDTTRNLVNNLTTQWFQHNPYRAKQVKLAHMSNAVKFNGEKIKSGEIPDIFKLKSIEAAGMEEIYYNAQGDVHEPAYLLLVGDDYSLNLYQKVGAGYSKIAVLGNRQKLIKEYNINNALQQSIFRDNVEPKHIRGVEIKRTEPIKQHEGNKIFTDYEFDKGFEAVLDNIINKSDNEFNKAVAKFFKDNIDNISDYNLEAFDEKRHYAPNKVKHPVGRTKNKGDNKFVAISNVKANSISKFEEVFLHELTHAFTSNNIDKKKSKELEDVFEAFSNNKDKLSDVEWLKQIGVQEIESDGWKYKDYIMTDQKEFAAFVLSSSDLQTILSNLEAEKGKSLLQKFKEAILKILGIDTGNTKLTEAVASVIDLVDRNDNTEDISGEGIGQSTEGFDTQFTLDLIEGHEFPNSKPKNKYIKSAII